MPILKTLPGTTTTTDTTKSSSLPSAAALNDIIYVEPTEGNGNTESSRWFQLDAVLDGTCTQHDVYTQSGAHQAVTQDLLQGFNCTILAYGQTGAGKTFTMGSAAAPVVAMVNSNGDKDDDPQRQSLEATTITDDCGVIPRAVSDLFDALRTRCQDQTATVELSYLEVYNEEIRDLLSSNNSNSQQQQQLRIREHLNGETYVRGLESRPVASPADVGKLMQQASQRRVTASTQMNAVSSRSHAICVLRIQGTLCETNAKFQAKLTLVDLAGSERIKKTGAQGDRAQEGISINKGLFVLGQVVSALSEQRPKMKRKPPYRDSKLTRLLQDSLGGNSRTIMIACVSPADFNLEESINTLRYATAARNITNKATRNVKQSMSPEEAAKLTRENELLKQEVRELQQTIERLTAEFEAREEPLVQEEIKEPEEEESAEELDEAHKRITELEHEVKHLHQALDKAKVELRASTTASAIELPALKVKVALLEDELNESRITEAEAEHLRQDFEELKTEASVARTAAKRLSHIVQDLSHRSLSVSEGDLYNMDDNSSSSIGSEILTDKELRAELERAKANEAWVTFIVRIYSLFKEDMRILGGKQPERCDVACP